MPDLVPVIWICRACRGTSDPCYHIAMHKYREHAETPTLCPYSGDQKEWQEIPIEELVI